MLNAHVQLLWCITQPHALSAILDGRISCITHSCTQGLQLFLGVVNLVMMQTFCVFWLMGPSMVLQVSQAASKLAKKVESLDLRESNPKSARAVLSSIQ